MCGCAAARPSADGCRTDASHNGPVAPKRATPFGVALFGATGRTRTGDLLITNQLLYQLSHSSINARRQRFSRVNYCISSSEQCQVIFANNSFLHCFSQHFQRFLFNSGNLYLRYAENFSCFVLRHFMEKAQLDYHLFTLRELFNCLL